MGRKLEEGLEFIADFCIKAIPERYIEEVREYWQKEYTQHLSVENGFRYIGALRYANLMLSQLILKKSILYYQCFK